MDKRFYIFSYSPHSRSGRSLAKALGLPLIRHDNSRFLPRRSKTVINWGSSNLPDHVRGTTVVNQPDDVHSCSNKLSFFEQMSIGNDLPRTVDWTLDPEEVLDWIDAKKTVVARTTLTGSGGQGIVFLTETNVGDYLGSPLFTLYKPKKEEYRVHLFLGRILDVQQKLLRKTDDAGRSIDPKTVDFRIRNHASGFVFARNGIDPPGDVLDQARRAFVKSGLTFGAVDVIWNEKEQQAYVLEINSAPGLEGTTLDNYVKAFRDYIVGASL